jgi:potassium-transporting ATPase KdpC subunit
MSRFIRPLLSLLLLFTVGLGLVYPAVVTGFAWLAFPSEARGSIVTIEQRAVGSVLIGQEFTRPEYFWGRPSATAPNGYNASASAASNLGPLNPALREVVGDRIKTLQRAYPTNGGPVPIDLVTASASGLDPHISPEAALYQVGRVAQARGLPEKVVRRLVEEHVEGRWPGMFGEPRVNVLLLNLALKSMERIAE